MYPQPAASVLTSVRARLSRSIGLLRPQIDSTTPEGRARERHRRAALSGMAALLAKSTSLVTTLISVPLTLQYLGTERYGMWMTISSIVAMLAFADLGMGNGILSSIAEAYGKDDRDAMRQTIGSGFVILGSISALVGALFFAVYPLVDWPALFNVESPAAKSEAGPAMAILVTCLAASIPSQIVQRVQMGLQRGFLASAWQAIGSLLSLAGLLTAIHFRSGLPWLIGAIVGLPLIANLANGVHFFLVRCPFLLPARSDVTTSRMMHIAGSGLLFLVLQIAMAVAYASDNVIIARTLGAASVAEFAVPEKMFSFVPLLLTMLLGPLWPAYGEAIARGDRHWVEATLRRSLLAAAVFSAAAGGLLFAVGPWLLSIWVGRAVNPPVLLLGLFALWKVFESTGNALAYFLNGVKLLRPQAVLASLMALSAISLKIVLVRSLGSPGVLVATIVTYGAFVLAPWLLYLPRVVRRL